ncbi:MAG TPA: haloacid dehalogenase type II [Nocardioidaceae bacterium]|nr:haloacid dehalogenase type II [Nocardioidaceae bacterium]
MTRPAVIVFDVNETLSDLAAIAIRFTDVGLPAHLAPTWFASVLRDGFALSTVGASERFAVLADQQLRTLADPRLLDRDLDAAVEHILTGFLGLPVHPDVVDGIRSLRAAGLRLVTLSNGATQVAENLLSTAGVRDAFEHLLSVEDAGIWKPHRRAYEYAAQVAGVDLDRMLLVAVHPWDLDGAARAGMSTAWIDRAGSTYPPFFTAPTHTVTALTDLPAALG